MSRTFGISGIALDMDEARFRSRLAALAREIDRRTPSFDLSAVGDTVQRPAAERQANKRIFVKGQTAASGGSAYVSDGTQWVPLAGTTAGFATPAVLYGTTYAAGVALTSLRSDCTLKYPASIMSSANSKLCTFTDDATNTFLASNFGNLTISPVSGGTIILDALSANLNKVVQVNVRPASTGTTGLAPSLTPSDMSSGTLRFWDVISSFSKQLISSTIRGYDMSGFTVQPTAGSDNNNTVQGAFFTGPLISNANAGYLAVEALYLQAARRVVSNPTLTQGNCLTVECPTIGSSIQAGIYIKQRTAQQTATTRYGILMDAMNSGTTRRSIGANNSFESITDDFIASGTAKGFIGQYSDQAGRYFRLRGFYNGGNPSAVIEDVGTSLPST